MKALVGAFNQEKALVGAFSVIVQPVVEPMDRFTAPLLTVVLTISGGAASHLLTVQGEVAEAAAVHVVEEAQSAARLLLRVQPQGRRHEVRSGPGGLHQSEMSIVTVHQ